ncbi:MAG: hypothetical protein ABMA64_36950, partial [Myxococcota bacterium]
LGAVVALAVVASAFRDGRVGAGIHEVPAFDAAGFVARYRAGAASALWVACTLVGLGVAASSGWRAHRRRLAGAAAAGALAVVCPPAGASAAALVLALGSDVGTAWIGAGLWFGAIAHRFHLAQLVSPADAAALDLATLAQLGAGLVAVGCAFDAPRLGAGLAALAAGSELSGARALAFGPVRELGAAALPVHLPARAARVPGGCLVSGSARSTVGRIDPGDHVYPCPPGAFPPDGVPIVAAPPDAPASALAVDGADQVRVAFRIAPGWSMPEWRVSSLEVPRFERSPPLPGAVLVHGDRAADAAGEGALAQVVARATALRLDVLIHDSAAPTVGRFLELCGEAVAARPAGPRREAVRCGVVSGPVDRWRRATRPLAAPAAIDIEWETVEEPAE